MSIVQLYPASYEALNGDMLRFYHNKMKKFFFPTLKFLVNGICLAFVIWQTILCIGKYFQNPKGTTITMEKSSEVPFPSITVCGYFGKKKNYVGLNLINTKRVRFNYTYLQETCGLSLYDYKLYGKWVGKNNTCSNPEQLFESIVLKIEDVIGYVGIYHWNATKARGYCSNKDPFKDWHIYDTNKYGRCFTLTPSKEDIQYGIKMIRLQLFVNSTILTHSKGMFLKGTHQDIDVGRHYDFGYVQESYELLDFGGDICNDDEKYSQDICNDEAIERDLLKKFGCTSPFGPNKTKICTKQDKGRKANDIFSAMNKNPIGECYHPCNFSTIALSESKSKIRSKSLKNIVLDKMCNSANVESSLVELHFKEIIKFTKAYQAYSPLSLIAEIGGYVGLFLGVSVNMVTNLMEFLFAKIRRLEELFQV